jgi:hypothetical protein
VAPGYQLSWNLLGVWLEKLKPKKMALIACEAGQFMPTRALFDELPTCRRIFASPFKTTKLQFRGVHVLLAYLLLGREYNSEHILAGPVSQFLL